MANVTFVNVMGSEAYLHMRIGSVDTPPDDRGPSNTVIGANHTIDVPVGDGDVWFCYGNQLVNSEENPQLCNAAGGTTVKLNGHSPCYVNN